MTGSEIIGSAILGAITVWLLLVARRAALKPRATPKVPRDRSRDTQVGVWFRLF